MWHIVVVYVGFGRSVLFALVWLYLILRTDYEGSGLCVLGVVLEEVTGSIEHRSLLMYLEVQNLNDYETLDMVQVNRKDKDKGRDMTQAVNEDFVKELF
jgi:hypothetical protein